MVMKVDWFEEDTDIYLNLQEKVKQQDCYFA